MNYHVRLNKGLIDVNTLSPNKCFFYRIKSAKALNKSAFGCPISFYKVDQTLIYHHSKTFAHELNSMKERQLLRDAMEANRYLSTNPIIKLVQWSNQGNWCYFLEYTEGPSTHKYESVFLDFKNACHYRINETSNDDQFVSENEIIDNGFDEEVILQKLKFKQYNCLSPICDKVKMGLFAKKWYP